MALGIRGQERSVKVELEPEALRVLVSIRQSTSLAYPVILTRALMLYRVALRANEAAKVETSGDTELGPLGHVVRGAVETVVKRKKRGVRVR